jgi:hypothetical protein
VTYVERQLRVRLFELLERRVKQFRTREELWPLRVPADPVALEDVVGEALGGERRAFDPLSLRSRTLLSLRWQDGSEWDLWVIVLPSKVKVYCDTGGGESRILASGGRNEGDESDRLVLTLLAESGGAHFGIEMAGDAPSSVRSSIDDRAFLADVFVDLFEGTEAEASVREQLAALDPHPPRERHITGHDFRADVERWLGVVMR